MNVLLIPFRVDSNRLPGKALLKIGDNTLLEYLILAGRRSSMIDSIMVVTTNRSEDKNNLEKYKDKCLVYSWEGHWNDVLGRFEAAISHIEKTEKEKVENVIRFTSDCPLLAYFPSLIDMIISEHLHADAEFTYNTHFERAYPSGLDVEIMKRSILKEINDKANYEEREHVTLYIKNHPKQFKIHQIKSPFKFNLKWSIDNSEDFERISDVVKLFRMQELLF